MIKEEEEGTSEKQIHVSKKIIQMQTDTKNFLTKKTSLSDTKRKRRTGHSWRIKTDGNDEEKSATINLLPVLYAEPFEEKCLFRLLSDPEEELSLSPHEFEEEGVRSVTPVTVGDGEGEEPSYK